MTKFSDTEGMGYAFVREAVAEDRAEIAAHLVGTPDASLNIYELDTILLGQEEDSIVGLADYLRGEDPMPEGTEALDADVGTVEELELTWLGIDESIKRFRDGSSGTSGEI